MSVAGRRRGADTRAAAQAKAASRGYSSSSGSGGSAAAAVQRRRARQWYGILVLVQRAAYTAPVRHIANSRPKQKRMILSTVRSTVERLEGGCVVFMKT